jgi:tRNA-dihydrouridine synthase A
MIGRAAYDNPYLLAVADSLWFEPQTTPPTRRQILEHMFPYLDVWHAQGQAANRTLRHMLGLFTHERVAKAWKRFLSDHIRPSARASAVLQQAMQRLPADVLDAVPVGPDIISASYKGQR